MDFDYFRESGAMIASFHWMREGSDQPDVTVIGGGLAGMAASIHLAKAGLSVLCLDAKATVSAPVGESLDWSAPALLTELGLDISHLISGNLATYKAGVTVQLPDGQTRHYVPGAWLAKAPYKVELLTLHVDRAQLDAAVREIMCRLGVALELERVTGVERDGRRINAVKTSSGRRIESRWFIDASGAGELFPRAFHQPRIDYGPRKVAIWSYFPADAASEGTTLYLDSEPVYMEWIWEIPIRKDIISVGYVAAGDAIREQRQQGLSVEEIFRRRLSRIPRFSALLSRGTAPNVRSFQCRVHKKLAGPNWVVVGEAASMVDPMTSNGVTAALRHAAEASNMIIRDRHRNRLSYVARIAYSKRVVDFGRFFNCGIEKVIYHRAVRARMGVLAAGRIYTVPAWVLNALYSRLNPRGLIATILFGFVLNLCRAAAVMLNFFCREVPA